MTAWKRAALAAAIGLAPVAAGERGAASAAELAPAQGSIVATAAPGKAIVRLDTAILTELGLGASTNDTAQMTTPAGPVNVSANSYAIMMFARLYPAFDAQTPGGFRYGGFAEIRGNTNTGAAGNGVAGTPSGVVGTAGQRNTNTLFWNRAYGYVGSDTLGLLRFGMVDGPFGLMKVGTFESFGDGGLNRSNLGLMPGQDSNIWYFPISVSTEYSSQKLSYTSPSFGGFDFGLSFAPSTATHQGSDGSTVVVGGSARQAVSTLASDANRYTNLFEALGRYRNTFGGVGVAASLGYMSSNNVTVPGIPLAGLSIFDAGAQASYAGFTFGGHVSTGKFNGSTSLAVPGAKTATVWLLGAQYEQGAWLVGAHYLNATIPNSTTIPQPAALRAQGVAAGVNWVWAPGAKLYLEALYITKSQPGIDLRLGNEAASTANASQIMIGQVFRW